MMPRNACFEVLAAVRGDAIVVSRYSAAFDWGPISPSPLNFFAIGAMGQCSSNALGLALGLPSTKVIVLDGDGSLLMNLGSLVTIASIAPKNLYHFVCENGCYEVNGGHPIPGQGAISFGGFARSAGYPHVFEFDDVEAFRGQIAGVLAHEGPVFATLKLVAADAQEVDFGKLNSAEARARFKDALRPLVARERMTL